MSTILVWLLISVSTTDGAQRGGIQVVSQFKTQQMCDHVRKNIPAQRYFEARCIQAEIVN